MPILEFKGKSFVQHYHLMLKHHHLMPDAARSRTDAPGLSDNLVVQGDNLLALSEHFAPNSLEKPETVYVIETKGLHLKNEDTDYKKALFALCNAEAKPQPWDAIKDELAGHQVKFQLLFSDEWENVLNAVLAA